MIIKDVSFIEYEDTANNTDEDNTVFYGIVTDENNGKHDLVAVSRFAKEGMYFECNVWENEKDDFVPLSEENAKVIIDKLPELVNSLKDNIWDNKQYEDFKLFREDYLFAYRMAKKDKEIIYRTASA